MPTTTPTPTAAAPRAGRREWAGLAVLALPTLLISIDVFVMLLALPHIAEALHATGTEQLWIMDVYGFLLAGLLVTMGTLADRIGRRKLLLAGAAAFGAASLAAAFAGDPATLIAARALLGVAGATLAPSTLGLISAMFTDARQRGLAVGIWLSCFMGGAAIGPVVGGVLLEHFWWGSAFLLGVPAMVLLLILGPVLLPEHRAPAGRRLDPLSVGLSLAAVLPAVWGLKEIAAHGWAAPPVAAVVAGLAAGTVFARRQRTLEHPLVDLSLFRSRAFSTALGGMFTGTLLMGAMMLFIAQRLQLVDGLGPLAAGLCMLPAAVASGVSFLVAPLLARRFRPAYLIAGGLLVSAAGLLLLTCAEGPALVAIAFATVNLGAGPLVTLATDLVLSAVPPERAGSAAALNETSGEFGYALGIAVLGSIGAAVYRSRTGGSGSFADAVRTAAALPAGPAAELLDTARAAFTAGLHVVAALSAAALVGLAALVAATLRHVRP